MGKSKKGGAGGSNAGGGGGGGGKGGKGGGGKSNKAPVCKCDDPYRCACGNRPERPSRGHKWDPETQTWGGKGHKQKGASGQTAVQGQAKITTTGGQTTLASWQRLPTQLLQEYVKRKAPLYKSPPKYKALETASSSGGFYKYRVIVNDGKDPKKDLIFVPAAPVANEEQAKEEAALLGLLHLTPTLPHERTLPEPYKTTWLNAVAGTSGTAPSSSSSGPPKKKGAAQKLQAKGGGGGANNRNSNNNNKSPAIATGVDADDTATVATTTTVASTSTTGGAAAVTAAQASTNLIGGRVTSQADREQAALERQKRINDRVRRQEAVQRANLNHVVFLSTPLRQEMEQLLRAQTNINNNDENDDLLQDPPASPLQEAVENRLEQGGFSPLQARRAFHAVVGDPNNLPPTQQQKDDAVFELCLQWLLIHIEEQHLPSAFAAKKGTLEFVKNTASDTRARAFQQAYRLSAKDMAYLQQQHQWKRAMGNKEEKDTALEDVYWSLVKERAGLAVANSSDEQFSEDCRAQFEMEKEALEAIYAESLVIEGLEGDKGLTRVALTLDDDGAKIEILLREGFYPQVLPERILVSWTATGEDASPVGSAFHNEMAKFLQSAETGEAMLFEIFGQATELLQSIDELQPMELSPSQTPSKKPTAPTTTSGGRTTFRKQSSHQSRPPPARRQRPRERSPFWSVLPKDTPPATAQPKIGPSMARARASLPAAKARPEFIQTLEKAKAGNRVLLLTGETGCGKSTQIPQFILEEYPSEAKIVVCQPRRVAATGVATRVAEERGESKPGIDSVGYVVRGDSALSRKSRLVFCTTGVLLRQMQSEDALAALTYIVLDEIHERSLDMDILLALLKEKIPSNPHLHVVLMSATLDADRFASYWGSNTPRIHIPGRTFPVKDFFLEDVLALTGYIPSKRKGKGGSDMAGKDFVEGSNAKEDKDGSSGQERRIDELVNRVDESSVDPKMIVSLVKSIISKKQAGDDGSVLIFLPGAPEINKCLEMLKTDLADLPLHLLALHGGLQPQEQSRVFQPAGSGKHKVICSTNIAETSVTIPDCTAVIDCGREKQSSYDPSNRMPLLLEQFCSKASLKQRRGRAGRVREGSCFKLISQRTFDKLRDHTEPEIRRSALDQTILSLLFLGIDCRADGSFMNSLLDKPDTDSLRAAMLSLQQLGAVDRAEAQLTPLGMHLAGIPAPPIVGKLLIMGSILGCRAAGIAMGAGMSLGRSLLLRIDEPRQRDELTMEQMRNKEILEERKKLFAVVGNSDHAFAAALFLKWQESDSRKRFCDDLGLSTPAMREMLVLNRQLDSALSSVGYDNSAQANANMNSWRVVRAVAVAGMGCTNMVKVVRPATKYQETVEGAKEKDGVAHQLKFFVRNAAAVPGASSRESEERVFIHPSSENFKVGNYNCPWLVYNSLVRTSKPFLRDITECSAYSLLLFGGELEIQASKEVVVIDGWCNLSAHARVGSLIGGIRRRLDELLDAKVSKPSFDIAGSPEMKLIVRLIVTNGEGS